MNNLINQMINWGIQRGIEPSMCKEIVILTFLGSIQLLKTSGLSCEELINQVTSKGGCAEAALKVFKESNFHLYLT